MSKGNNDFFYDIINLCTLNCVYIVSVSTVKIYSI